MSYRLKVVIAILTFSTVQFFPTTAAEYLGPDQPHIIVHGYGQIEQIPDKAIIRFEVSAIDNTLYLAKESVDKTIAKAIKVAKKERIDEDDISASKINASPQYDWQNKTRVYKGERVSRQVEVNLSDIKRYNSLVDGLLLSGISRLQPVELGFSEQKKLENKALTLALDDAKLKAKTMAEHLGTEVDGIFQIAPIEHGSIVTRMAMQASAESRDDKAPLKPGKQKIQQQIRVIYLLKKEQSVN